MDIAAAREGHWESSRPRMSGEKIFDSLRLLARDSSPLVRQQAARQLIVQLRILVRSRGFWAKAGWRMGPQRIPIWTAEDAIQHVLLVASTGGSRFRGEHAKEAIAWCHRVLNNFAISEWRWRSRFRAWPATPPQPAHAVALPFEVAVEPSAIQEPRTALLRIRLWAQAHLQQTRRPRAASSLFDAVCCYLDDLEGVSIERQLERWASSTKPMGDDPEGDRERARNRLYQYHRRGKAVLMEFFLSSDERLKHQLQGSVSHVGH